MAHLTTPYLLAGLITYSLMVLYDRDHPGQLFPAKGETRFEMLITVWSICIIWPLVALSALGWWIGQQWHRLTGKA